MTRAIFNTTIHQLLAATLCLCACGGTGGGGPRPSPDPSTCGPQNCAGCCLGGVCSPGTSAVACGGGGAQCNACQDHQACLPEQRCGLLPSQRWLLAASSASIAPTNNGLAWDADSSPPDPYVLFDGASRTPVQQNTYGPAWHAGFIYTAQQLQAGVRVQVFDEDLVNDDPISAARTLRLGEPDIAAGEVTVSGWDGVQRITFALEKR